MNLETVSSSASENALPVLGVGLSSSRSRSSPQDSVSTGCQDRRWLGWRDDPHRRGDCCRRSRTYELVGRACAWSSLALLRSTKVGESTRSSCKCCVVPQWESKATLSDSTLTLRCRKNSSSMSEDSALEMFCRRTNSSMSEESACEIFTGVGELTQPPPSRGSRVIVLESERLDRPLSALTSSLLPISTSPPAAPTPSQGCLHTAQCLSPEVWNHSSTHDE